MRLKQLKIRNFKCFKEERIVDFNRLTLLTGPNSSGKSSILYGILGSLQSGEFPIQFSTNGKYVNMGDFREISFNHDVNNEIHLGFTFNDGLVLEVDSIWVEDKSNNLPQLKQLSAKADYFKLCITKKNKYSLSYNYFPDKDPSMEFFNSESFQKLISTLSSIKIETKENEEKPTKKQMEFEDLYKDYNKPQEINDLQFRNFDELKKHLKTTGGIRLQQIIDSVSNAFKAFDEKVNFISSFRLDPQRTYLEKTRTELKVEKTGEGYLDQIIYWETKRSKKLKDLIIMMKKLSLLVDIKANRFEGGRYEMLVKTKKTGLLTSLSDVGFGISQFLPIIVADLQLPKDSTLFIAQPEIHLHPSVQSLFGEFLTEQINNSQKSYIIETHSEYLINRIRLAIVKGQLKEDDLSVYFAENKTDDAIIHKIKFTKNGQILNAPDDFFKTYMIDVMEIALNAE